MGDGEYKPGKLISGWNGGNKLAYSMLTNEQYKSEIALFPTKRLHHSWQWNLYRTSLQNQIGESKFVPCIMLLSIDGSTV
ncbi:MAG: hypothetical protein K2Q15_08045, partial [Burkholderiales bacterium]|nr:hypothetical protein [Burkholderiales bacterium]